MKSNLIPRRETAPKPIKKASFLAVLHTQNNNPINLHVIRSEIHQLPFFIMRNI